MNDRINKGKMKVEYCITHIMLVYFFTKPLMGNMFRKFVRVVMGYASIFELVLTLLQSIRECAGI